MNDNRKNALLLACLSLASALWAAWLIAVRIEFWFNPVIVIYASLPLAGIMGILSRNKGILLTSALISLALTVLGMMSVGGLFVASSAALLLSVFVYLSDSEKVVVDQRTKTKAYTAAAASLVFAAAGAAFESSWLFVKAVSMGLLISDIEFIFIFSLPVILPAAGMVGIRDGNREFLNASAAISMVLTIFIGVFLQKPLFIASSILLIFAGFTYRSRIQKETSIETVDAGHGKIALCLAGISLLFAVITTLCAELILVDGGCYSFQLSPTSGGRICGDFRPDYIVPVLASITGIAGILRIDKSMLAASATVSLLWGVMRLLQAGIGRMFFPASVLLVLSAFVYQKGIRKGTMQGSGENGGRLRILMLLLAFAVLWIIAVYMLVQPSAVNSYSGYGSGQAASIP